MRNKIAELLPDWGPVRWTAVILAATILILTGISLFHVPAHEVMYSPMRICMPSRERKDTLVFYSVELGNTGSEPQERVKIRFLKEAMDRRILPLSVQNYGITAREFSTSNDATITTIDIGRLEPEARVKVAFALSYPEGREPNTWDQLFRGVEPAKGSARHGDPGMTMVGRAWFALFGRWLPF